MKSLRDISKKVGRGLTALALVGSLSGCGRDSSQDFEKMGTYKGYEVGISIDGAGRRINLSSPGSFSYLHAEDSDNDKRFDIIKLRNMYKGHPLEKYANLEDLEQIYNEIKGASE